MRILHSIRSVNPEGGGVIEAVKQVSRIHQENGHEVEVVSLDSPDDDWVHEFPFKLKVMGPAQGKFGFTGELLPWLRTHIAAYDAIIVNGIWQYNSYGIWLAFRHAQTPYYVFPHGMLDPWFRRTYPLKHLKKWLYWPWADYRVLRDARATVFTSEEERQLARESFWLYRCREMVVPLGIAEPGGDSEAQKVIFLDRFPGLRGKRFVLFLGRIHKKKGCEMLIKAFAKFIQAPEEAMTSQVELVMAGPDQAGWLAELQNLATDLGIARRVTWTGMLSGDVKLGALRAAEVFILPSHQENFGIAVAESLACSVPVLISNKVNIWREIAEDNAGLVENDDETGTFQLIKRWFSLPESARQACRDHARECFAGRFEIKRTAGALINLFRESQP
jgi:glycosyltransferase involved in cell wall biosynthesis